MEKNVPASVVAVPVLAAGYVLIPTMPIRFACLVTALWLAGRSWPARASHGAAVALATIGIGGALLMNPLARLQTTGPAWLWQAGLWGAAVAWGALLLRGTSPRRLRPWLPGGVFVAVWLALFLARYWPTWGADIAYAGDEGYHMMSVSMCRLMLAAVAGQPWLVAATLVWAAAGMALAWRGRGEVWWHWLVWAAAGLGVMAAMPWAYPPALLADEFTTGRVLRYPLAQTWASALLGAVCFEYWEQVFRRDMLRLLPVLSLCLLGIGLGGDWRWRRERPWITALAVLAVLTVPNLQFHATILYLDLPLAVAMTVWLARGDGWLALPATELRRRWSWWAVGLTGLLKELALPFVLIALAARWGRRALAWRQGRRLTAREVLEETLVALVAMGPLAIYLALRLGTGARPYGGQWLNVCRADLWAESLGGLAMQTGPLILLAGWGAVAGWRNRRGVVVWCLLVLAGMQVFFLCDYGELAGLARFNLYLLPPLLALGWEGLTDLRRRRRAWGLGALAAVLAANGLLAPMTLDGTRRPWGRTGELWYPFTRCLEELRQEQPMAKVLAGNMVSEYPFTTVLAEMGWATRVDQVGPWPVAGEGANLRATLAYARERGYGVVIYRQDADSVPAGPQEGFRLLRAYPAAQGRLAVYVRADTFTD